jgi:hypothetical protein
MIMGHALNAMSKEFVERYCLIILSERYSVRIQTNKKNFWPLVS